MNIFYLRFTVRRLMIALAIVGLMIWFVKMREVALKHREEAKNHSELEKLYIDMIDDLKSSAAWRLGKIAEEQNLVAKSTTPQEREYHEKQLRDLELHFVEFNNTLRNANILIKYHKTLKIKYEYFANRPWLPVEPDPPTPE